MAKTKTLADLMADTRECITANDVAGIIGSNPHTIRVIAKQRPELLPFPTFVVCSTPEDTYYAHVKIPRIPFLRYMGMDV